MPSVNLLDVLAVILGGLYMLRKLSVQRQVAADFPHVEASSFEAWKQQQLGAYRLGSWACFSKVVVDLAFTGLLARHLDVRVVWIGGAAIDFTWVVVLVWAFVRSRAAHKLAARLDIRIGSPVPSPNGQ